MNRILRIGTGCGIEIRGPHLNVVVVRSRPNGVSIVGRTMIHDFRERPAAEWGAEYAGFLKGLDLSHLSATVSLPREDLIVREINLPLLSGKELASAVRYRLDDLHPFEQDDVYYAYARLPQPAEGAAQLPLAVVIAEKEKVDDYSQRFEEAGIAVEAFTAIPAAFYAGVRVRWDSPPAPFVIADVGENSLEIYGEGAARPLFSAQFDLSVMPAERALQLAGADLRLQESEAASLVVVGDRASGEDGQEASSELEVSGPFEPRAMEELLPTPIEAPADFDSRRNAGAFAVGLEAACPRLGWRANLLPAERRKKSSRWMYAPTAALGVALLLLGVAFLVRPLIQDSAYAAAVRAETAKLETVAANVDQLREQTEQFKTRLALLESLRERTQNDLAIVRELSELLPNTVWLTKLEVTDEGVQMHGHAGRAAPLLELINGARTLTKAEFLSSLVTTDEGDRFQIGAERSRSGEEQVEQAAVGSAPAGGATTLSTVGEMESRPGE